MPMDISQCTQQLLSSVPVKTAYWGKFKAYGIRCKYSVTLDVSKEYAFESLSRTQIFYECGDDDNGANNCK